MAVPHNVATLITPIEIHRVATIKNEAPVGDGLEITWSDGNKQFLSSKLLREACPCATCLEARGDVRHQKPLSAARNKLQVIKATVDEALNLKQVSLVGNYAIELLWGDRHNTGIYSFELLRELGDKTTSE